MKKGIVSLLVVMCMLAAFAPWVRSAEIVDSGSCGDNLTWMLDSEGTLKIAGSGNMDDFEYTPWSEYYSEVKTIIIETGVTSICDYAFWSFINLNSISIPNSITILGDGLLEGCQNLQSVIIGSGVNRIADNTFYECTSLTNIDIPDNVLSIGNNAFGNCNSLTEINMPDNIASIGDYAFFGCTSLGVIDIPNSVINIGSGAFGYCGVLSIEVDSNNYNFCDIDGVLFNKDKSELLAYSKDQLQPEYTIPNGVTNICDNAFYTCVGLTELTIPDSVISIGNNVFQTCNSLERIHISDGLISIGSWSFAGCNLKHVYYGGTQSQWESISIAIGNDTLRNATIHYNSVISTPSPTPSLHPHRLPCLQPRQLPRRP